MKILVTGANGYIGRHITEKLLEKGHELYACDIKFDQVDKQAIPVKISIFSGDQDIFEQVGKPDACVHMAWRDGFSHNSDAHMGDLSAHYLFIKNMLRGGLKNLTVMGSMHEVGYFEGAISEDTPCNPSSFYGISKLALRQATTLLCNQYHASLKWLRAYYIYGDDLNNHSIFTKLIQAAQEGKKTFPFTTGKNKYDFISVDKLASQIAAAAVQSEVEGIIECCSGEPVSLADKVNAFIKENQLDIQLAYGAFPDRPYDSPGVWGNSQKIQKILKSSE